MSAKLAECYLFHCAESDTETASAVLIIALYIVLKSAE